MNPAQMLQNYRRMVATEGSGKTHWWYIGTTFIEIDGYPSIPVAQPETLMVYDTTTISNDSFSIVWNEIGYFRDCISGEIIDVWQNPITGERVAAPKSFIEGPAQYTISSAENEVSVALVQPNAIVAGVSVKTNIVGERIWITQVERKSRGFPQRDGSLPEAGSSQTADAVTTLSFSSDVEALAGASPSVPCIGYYEFRLGTLPEWMGFGDRRGRTVVKGVIVKCEAGEVVNRQSTERLRELYPNFFVQHA